MTTHNNFKDTAVYGNLYQYRLSAPTGGTSTTTNAYFDGSAFCNSIKSATNVITIGDASCNTIISGVITNPGLTNISNGVLGDISCNSLSSAGNVKFGIGTAYQDINNISFRNNKMVEMFIYKPTHQRGFKTI